LLTDKAYTSDDFAKTLPAPVGYPTTYSAMIAQARLAIIANKIYNEFLAAHISNVVMNEDLARKFEEELHIWRTSLPSYFYDSDIPQWFHGSRAVILWKEQNLRMMMWRGGQRSYKARSRSEAAVQNCLNVAIESTQAICNFCLANEALHQGLSWYATYFLFQAVLVVDFGLLQSPEDLQASLWRETIDQARLCLSKLGTTNPAAGRCISVLDRIHAHHLLVASSQRRQPVQQSNDSFARSIHATLQDTTSSSFDQAYPADPALQFFLDGPPMSNLFDGLSGFPSTQENENFDYIPGDFYTMEDFDMSMTWPDYQY
jgi:transcriptional regulatory protein GAL4